MRMLGKDKATLLGVPLTASAEHAEEEAIVFDTPSMGLGDLLAFLVIMGAVGRGFVLDRHTHPECSRRQAAPGRLQTSLSRMPVAQ
jgi:hypothetical protein